MAKVVRPVSPAQQEVRASDGIVHIDLPILLQAIPQALTKTWTLRQVFRTWAASHHLGLLGLHHRGLQRAAYRLAVITVFRSAPAALARSSITSRNACLA